MVGGPFGQQDFVASAVETDWPWGDGGQWYATAGDALRALATWGCMEGWRRLWVPSFYDQPRLLGLLGCGLSLAVYPDDPRRSVLPPDIEPGDALLLTNTFGLRARPELPRQAIVVEDHSHDPAGPWAIDSRAHYCIAGLDETLPVPDGAVLWSPSGRLTPDAPEPTPAQELVALRRLAGQLLLGRYTAGHAVAPEAFEPWLELRTDPSEVAGALPWTRAVLPSLPAGRWSGARRRNHARLRSELGGLPWLRVLPSEAGSGAPLALVAVVDTARRCDDARRTLQERGIGTMAPWSLHAPALEGIPEAHLELSARLLALPCDHRLRPDDLQRIIGEVRSLG
jgi:hypothetical protein